MDRINEFPKQEFDDLICELWSGLNTSLYHKAYVDVYANTVAMQEVGSRLFQTVGRAETSQEKLNQRQEDLIVFRAHFAGVLWQLNHLGNELLRKAYRIGKQEGIIKDTSYTELMKALDDDPIPEEILKYRNMSHQFAGVIVTVHDSQTHAFVAHVLPPLGNNAATEEMKDRPFDEEQRERELGLKLNSYVNHIAGYCEGLFRVVDERYQREVFPRTH